MILPEILVAAFMLGLMGAGHCLGMCGGVAAALSFANAAEGKLKSLTILVSYNLGRVASYAVIGGLAALVAGLFEGFTPIPLLRTLSGVLLIAMGLYLGDWWKALTALERAGSLIWKLLAPLSQKLMPVKKIPNAVLLGLIWGWLPCGLVYSALAYAAVQASFSKGALVMLMFGLGTLPAVLAGGLASDLIKKTISQLWVRRVFGVLFIAYGVYTLVPVVRLALVAMGVTDAPHEMHHHHH